MSARRTRQVVAAAIVAFVVAFAAVLVADRAVAQGPAAAPPAPPRRAMPPEERARRYHPGPTWDGVGRGRLTQADVDNFSDYPLFWLGESFGGFNLYAVNRTKYARPGPVALATGPNTPPKPLNLPPEQDEVTFTYGDCTRPPGASSCSPPVSIIVESGCQVRPEWVADRVKAGPPQEVRGQARLQRFGDGHVRLWVGRVSIRIETSGDPALIDQAVQQLRGAGRVAGLGAGQSLGPPDFSGCP